MPVKFTIVKNSLNGEDTHYARTSVNNLYNTSQFLDKMLVGGKFQKGEYECFFRELLEKLGEVIVEGSGISIERRLRIVPVVKGGFDSTKDSFDRSRNSLSINITMSKSYIDKLMPRMHFERVEPRRIEPFIREIKENPLKANLLFLSINNNIDGNDFTCEGLTFEKIELINREDMTLTQEIPVELLHVYGAGKKRFSFIFRREFQPAEWLVNGIEIDLILHYYDEEKKYKILSNTHTTRWAFDDKVELPELKIQHDPVLV